MKLKDFFLNKNKQAKISNEDFNKVVETMPDMDLPDVWVNLFDNEFLTRERAVADQKIYAKIQAEQLDAVDKIVVDYIPLVGDDDKVAVQNEKSTFQKLKLLKDGIAKSIDRIKTENPSNDEKIKELTKQNQEYVSKIAAVNKQWETTLTEKEKAFEEHKKGMQLDWTLDKKVGEFTFADEYKELRPTLTKSIIDKIRTENVLVLDESGNIQVHEKTDSGVTKQKFNGNDAVTLEKLLEDPLKPFLKKNNAADPPKPGAAAQRQNPGRSTDGNPDPNKLTLQQRRQLGQKMFS